LPKYFRLGDQIGGEMFNTVVCGYSDLGLSADDGSSLGFCTDSSCENVFYVSSKLVVVGLALLSNGEEKVRWKNFYEKRAEEKRKEKKKKKSNLKKEENLRKHCVLI
jgi:hypothetical protein